MKNHSRSKATPTRSQELSPQKTTHRLLSEIRSLIDSARGQVAQAVNAGLVILYWQIGKRIRQDILHNKRAGYGEQIVHTLCAQLTADYGKGFSRTSLFGMVRFAEVYPHAQIVQTLSGQLGWSHFLEIIYFEDRLKRDFYSEMCRLERWSVRTLRAKIGGLLYERIGLSRKPRKIVKEELGALRKENRLTPDLIFRDPYFLDFLGLKGSYSEKDLEAAILRELEQFLIELGTDFTFVARQKRITVDQEDYYLDLLFYHRRLRCLVALELKLDKFRPGDKGQMELYLRWLEKHDTRPGENPPLGLILCSAKGHEAVELLRLEQSGIRMAQYLTQLPPRRLLKDKLHQAAELAAEQIARKKKAVSVPGGI